MSRTRQTTILTLALLLLVLGPAPRAAAEDGAGTSPSQESGARLDAVRTNEFFYQSYGKPDPFRTLVDGDYEPSSGGELVDVNSAKLVGVMWGDDDQFALVEDGDGFGYILRVGDRVLNGRVVSIHQNRLTARLTLYGISNTVVLKLEKSEAK
ncbi:MAG TPA: hypothetical protein PLL30_06785 [Candidatus Krumholzibacteria bacterium]|nr:hypothetical protein [Candidatus Krumholzibacteria bacterium]HPD71467.1 hypothetical protein [Candidatus Krumholzibacteria bacterium]HRY41600.1 hypothetical protein [Candidatus Krumholzibacteria bacterium]